MAAALASLVFWLGVFDTWTPRLVRWRPTRLNGWTLDRVDGLVVQHQCGSEVWATRGYAVYRSRNEGPFVRVAHVPARPGVAFIGHSRLLRRLTRRTVRWVQVFPLEEDILLAFVGRCILKGRLRERRWRVVYRDLRFGLHMGHGVLRTGITRDDAGAIWMGDWFNNLRHGLSVRVLCSRDGGDTWRTALEIPASEIQHFHAVQFDPYDRALWLTTGDADDESRIGFSKDELNTITWIGSGGQKWRTTQLVFFKDRVVWGMDSPGSDPCSIYQWMRDTGEFRKAADIPSVAFYGQRLDTGDGLGLIGLGYRHVSCWMGGPGGPWKEILRWEVVMTRRPSLRFPRNAGGGDCVYLHLHMTVEGDDVIVRAPKAFFEAQYQNATDRGL